MLEVSYKPVIKLSQLTNAVKAKNCRSFYFDFTRNDDNICRFPLDDNFINELKNRKNELTDSNEWWDKETIIDINNTLAAIDLLREIDKEEVLIDVDEYIWAAMPF